MLRAEDIVFDVDVSAFRYSSRVNYLGTDTLLFPMVASGDEGGYTPRQPPRLGISVVMEEDGGRRRVACCYLMLNT